MQQSIIDFLSGLSKSIIQGFSEALKHGGIGNSIKDGQAKGFGTIQYALFSVINCYQGIYVFI